MSRKRKQEKINSQRDLLIPITLKDIGSDKDPCFGKGYDLSTSECKRCGDSEFCSIAMAQNLNITRKELEKANSYKDMDSTLDVPTVKKYMKKLISNGSKRSEVIRLSKERYELSREDARTIYKSISNEK